MAYLMPNSHFMTLNHFTMFSKVYYIAFFQLSVHSK